MRILAAIILVSTVSSGVFAQATGTSAKPKLQKAALAPAKKPPITRTVETQLSGFTSQDADQLYARLALQETRAQRSWYVRGAISRTVTKNGSTSSVITSKLDSRLEHSAGAKSYSVWTGVLSGRDRDYSTKQNDQRSGYEFLSYGYGRQLGAKAKGDIGLGVLKVWDDETSTRPSVVFSVRGRHPLNKSLTFESDTLLIQPLDALRSTKIDSDLALAHELAPGLSLRLGWSLNNLIRSIHNNREWDSIVRLSISYRRTSTK